MSGQVDSVDDVETEGRRQTLARALAWAGAGVLAVLFLLGTVNLVAPHVLSGGLLVSDELTRPPARARPQAAIVDQTGLSFPSEPFIAAATALLEDAGYEVTYHTPEEITVSFYRSLPGRGYDFIVLQTHATSQVVARDGGQSENPPGPFLFTTEPYETQRHLALQMSDQVRASQLFYEDAPELFAVGPAFVRRSMQGFFPGTAVIIGGCQSLAAPGLATALLDKGASVVVGWDGMVNLSHNNEAVLHLLEMLVDGATASDAVETTMDVVGPDPQFRSELKLME